MREQPTDLLHELEQLLVYRAPKLRVILGQRADAVLGKLGGSGIEFRKLSPRGSAALSGDRIQALGKLRILELLPAMAPASTTWRLTA